MTVTVIKGQNEHNKQQTLLDRRSDAGGGKRYRAGGVSLDRTRLIITGKDSSASANLTNTSPDIPFLAQSWVEDSKGNKITSPLVVLPPLQRINGGQKGSAGHQN